MLAAGGAVAIGQGNADSSRGGGRLAVIAVAVGQGADQCLCCRRIGVGVQGDDQVAGACAAHEGADNGSGVGDVAAADADLTGAGAFVDDPENVFAADAVAGDRDGQGAAVKVRGVAVGDRGVAACVQAHGAAAFHIADRITAEIADHRRSAGGCVQGEVVAIGACIAQRQRGAADGTALCQTAEGAADCVGTIIADDGKAAGKRW